jgi:hypothetical protein
LRRPAGCLHNRSLPGLAAHLKLQAGLGCDVLHPNQSDPPSVCSCLFEIEADPVVPYLEADAIVYGL